MLDDDRFEICDTEDVPRIGNVLIACLRRDKLWTQGEGALQYRLRHLGSRMGKPVVRLSATPENDLVQVKDSVILIEMDEFSSFLLTSPFLLGIIYVF